MRDAEVALSTTQAQEREALDQQQASLVRSFEQQLLAAKAGPANDPTFRDQSPWQAYYADVAQAEAEADKATQSTTALAAHTIDVTTAEANYNIDSATATQNRTRSKTIAAAESF